MDGFEVIARHTRNSAGRCGACENTYGVAVEWPCEAYRLGAALATVTRDLDFRNEELRRMGIGYEALLEAHRKR